MKITRKKTDRTPRREAGTGLIALLGREDGRALAAIRRRLAKLRHGLVPIQIPAGPRHD